MPARLTSHSIFRLHVWQEYSYNGIGFGSLQRCGSADA
jgi:hypothetical protein